MSRIVIGIDQSYKNTGISIAQDGKLIKVKSLDLSTSTFNSEKRSRLRNIVVKLINSCQRKDSDLIIICERIRTFSGGFLSTEYIKQTGALISTIVDAAYDYGVPVYSVDTRAWKSAVIGTSKSEQGDKKLPAINFVRNLGWEDAIMTQVKRKKKGSFERDGAHYVWNDDAADSACIALFGFTPGFKDKLKVEH